MRNAAEARLNQHSAAEDPASLEAVLTAASS
jgi:hypothetical protein